MINSKIKQHETEKRCWFWCQRGVTNRTFEAKRKIYFRIPTPSRTIENTRGSRSRKRYYKKSHIYYGVFPNTGHPFRPRKSTTNLIPTSSNGMNERRTDTTYNLYIYVYPSGAALFYIGANVSRAGVTGHCFARKSRYTSESPLVSWKAAPASRWCSWPGADDVSTFP